MKVHRYKYKQLTRYYLRNVSSLFINIVLRKTFTKTIAIRYTIGHDKTSHFTLRLTYTDHPRASFDLEVSCECEFCTNFTILPKQLIIVQKFNLMQIYADQALKYSFYEFWNFSHLENRCIVVNLRQRDLLNFTGSQTFILTMDLVEWPWYPEYYNLSVTWPRSCLKLFKHVEF